MSFIIIADGTMVFTGRKFSSKEKAKVFATRERAVSAAIVLARKFPVLYKHLLAVKPYRAAPKKSIRKNPSKSALSLWSRRFSVARGWEWKIERGITPENANEWLRAFRKDEPGIEFKVSRSRPKEKARKNPARRKDWQPRWVREAEATKADALLESFSGSRASKEIRATVRPITTGLVVGKLSGVMYAADRGDGVHEYCHRFKTSSRPLLIADHDGTQLGIVGGRYQFTDRGIVDR
jgi:hypothetical protein